MKEKFEVLMAFVLGTLATFGMGWLTYLCIADFHADPYDLSLRDFFMVGGIIWSAGMTLVSAAGSAGLVYVLVLVHHK